MNKKLLLCLTTIFVLWYLMKSRTVEGFTETKQVSSIDNTTGSYGNETTPVSIDTIINTYKQLGAAAGDDNPYKFYSVNQNENLTFGKEKPTQLTLLYGTTDNSGNRTLYKEYSDLAQLDNIAIDCSISTFNDSLTSTSDKRCMVVQMGGNYPEGKDPNPVTTTDTNVNANANANTTTTTSTVGTIMTDADSTGVTAGSTESAQQWVPKITFANNEYKVQCVLKQ